jgi:hypothetical protein
MGRGRGRRAAKPTLAMENGAPVRTAPFEPSRDLHQTLVEAADAGTAVIRRAVGGTVVLARP